MTIPQLPTDNLYKFISLSGLSLIVLNIYLFYVSEDINTKINIDLEVELDAIHMHSIEVNRQATMSKTNLEKYCQEFGCECVVKYTFNTVEISSISNDCKNKIEIQQELKKYIQKIEMNIEKVNELMKSSVKKRTLLRENKKAWNKKKIGIYSIGIFGFVLTVFGFLLWYYKVQKMQDIILKKQATLSDV